MRRSSSLAAVAVALACCGRVDFDASLHADASSNCPSATGHDEDGDGIDDACDGCPNIFDPTQPDRDGDGVDDACDPHPDTPGDAIAFFDPFTGPRSQWTFGMTQPSYDGDDLVVDTLGSGYLTGALPRFAADATYSMGFAITAVGGSNEQILISLYQDYNDSYYCELLDAPSESPAFGYTEDNDGTYDRLATGQMPALAVASDVDLTLTNAPPNAACATTWAAAPNDLTGAIPNEITPVQMRIGIQGLNAAVHWFIVITSPAG
jgi:hypothetical protein